MAVTAVVADGAEQVAGADPVARGHRGPERETTPVVKGGQAGAAGQERPGSAALPGGGERGERPAGAVDDAAEQARAELDTERPAGPGGGITGAQAAGQLVDLGDGLTPGEPDDLAGQLAAAHQHHVEQPRPAQPADADDRAGDPHDGPPGAGPVRLRAISAASQRRRNELSGPHRLPPIGSKVNS